MCPDEVHAAVDQVDGGRDKGEDLGSSVVYNPRPGYLHPRVGHAYRADLGVPLRGTLHPLSTSSRCSRLLTPSPLATALWLPLPLPQFPSPSLRLSGIAHRCDCRRPGVYDPGAEVQACGQTAHIQNRGAGLCCRLNSKGRRDLLEKRR